MTTTFYLVRHAAHDNLGHYLAGRLPGVRLGADGKAQARRLGERMRRERFDHIWTSPRERARETAQALAAANPPHEPEIAEELDEIDFGSWSGADFASLADDPLWRLWNSARSLARTPGGETMLDVQRRMLHRIELVRSELPDGGAVLVSHADPIKAAVSYFLGLPVDAWPRFDIAPGSITKLAVWDCGAQLLCLGEVVA